MGVYWRRVEAESPPTPTHALLKAPWQRSSGRPGLLTPDPGDRAAEAHLVELGQLAVGCVLLGCVLGTLGQSRLGTQHLQERERWKKGWR